MKKKAFTSTIGVNAFFYLLPIDMGLKKIFYLS